MNSLNKTKLTIIVVLIISGATDTLCNCYNIIADKFQNQHFVYEQGYRKYLYHPYLSVLLITYRLQQFASVSYSPFLCTLS
jgi:hypothetical protein